MKVMKSELINKKRLELHLDSIIENDVIGDTVDWLVNLATTNQTSSELFSTYEREMEIYHILLMKFIKEEDYVLCAKLRDVIEITTNDIIRIIRMKKFEDEEEILADIKFFLDVYKKGIEIAVFGSE